MYHQCGQNEGALVKHIRLRNLFSSTKTRICFCDHASVVDYLSNEFMTFILKRLDDRDILSSDKREEVQGTDEKMHKATFQTRRKGIRLQLFKAFYLNIFIIDKFLLRDFWRFIDLSFYDKSVIIGIYPPSNKLIREHKIGVIQTAWNVSANICDWFSFIGNLGSCNANWLFHDNNKSIISLMIACISSQI